MSDEKVHLSIMEAFEIIKPLTRVILRKNGIEDELEIMLSTVEKVEDILLKVNGIIDTSELTRTIQELEKSKTAIFN